MLNVNRQELRVEKEGEEFFIGSKKAMRIEKRK